MDPSWVIVSGRGVNLPGITKKTDGALETLTTCLLEWLNLINCLGGWKSPVNWCKMSEASTVVHEFMHPYKIWDLEMEIPNLTYSCCIYPCEQ